MKWGTDNIKCYGCNKKENVKVLNPYSDDAVGVPNGWFVLDTYPPGDCGPEFACSMQCAEKYVRLNRTL